MNVKTNETSKDFSNFVKLNRDKIYATTPRIDSIPQNDEWVNETEWDDLFNLLSAKKK